MSSDAHGQAAGDAAGRSRAGGPPSALKPTFPAGIIGGIYLVYIVGWIVSVLRLGTPTDQPFTGLMHTIGVWLAVFSPLIWFGVTLLLTRKSAARVRIIWLIVGVIVLIPWPFALGVSS